MQKSYFPNYINIERWPRQTFISICQLKLCKSHISLITSKLKDDLGIILVSVKLQSQLLERLPDLPVVCILRKHNKSSTTKHQDFGQMLTTSLPTKLQRLPLLSSFFTQLNTTALNILILMQLKVNHTTDLRVVCILRKQYVFFNT